MSVSFATTCSDPCGWARYPRSALALKCAREVAERDPEFRAIVNKHVEDGVCTAEGRLLKRWDGQRWVAA